jgi:Kef-type K+ transport system membrane component KefB
VPWLLSAKRMQSTAVTVVFALTVLLLTTACYGLKLSPLLAALSFGIVARERRVHLTNAQRDFGSVGELLGIFLFVYVASLVQWPSVLETLALGVALLLVRSLSKVVCNLAVARLSGITERKGWLTGLALTPMSAFVILLLEQTRLSGFEPATQAFAVMAGFLVLLELLGPVVTQRSLMASNETHITLEPALGPATAPDAQGQSRESSRAT